MSATAFDTLQAANALQEAGIERPHAEAIAHVVNLRAEDYATKADLAALEARLVAKIEALEAKIEALEAKIGAMIDARVEQAKNVILRAILAASVAIIVSLLGGMFAIVSAI